MNPKIYRQNDPKWGTLVYKNSPYTVASDGCGLCAVTHCAIELKKYKNYTPKSFYTFMRKYATNGDGTEWVGIDEGLKKYIGNYKRHYSMESFWTELNKGNRIGIILFGNGVAPDGTQWTKGGHYVAFVDYTIKNNNHWLYTKDSNASKCLDGWHSYEKSMKGCIPDVMWTTEIPKDGWYKENGYWYYYDSGVMVTNNWAQDDSKKWFYLGSDGKMVTSKWVKWKDEWYYLKEDGAMASNEWIKDSTGWCYLNKNGKMAKGAWVKWKNNMYYIDGKGHMVTGSRNVPCEFDDTGKLII